MKKNKCYEIYLKKSSISSEEWEHYIKKLAKFIGFLRSFKILINIDKHKVHYYIFTSAKLPNSLNSGEILIEEKDYDFKREGCFKGFIIHSLGDNFLQLINRFYKKDKEVTNIYISFWNIGKGFKTKTYVFYDNNEKKYFKRVWMGSCFGFLNVDYKLNPSYIYNKVPKYFKLDKVIHLLQNKSDNALFQIDGFPYFDSNLYLTYDAYDFYKHSFVIGSSGSGKSKFLASLITKVCNNSNGYKVIVIDPHDSLKNDLYPISNNTIIDFQDNKSSVNLFSNPTQDVNASLELTMSLLKSFINNGFNSKLERVLRFSCYLLLVKNNLNFSNLRKLLIDMEYRNNLIEELKRIVPASVSFFFLTEFNELKASSYGEAIAPIIAFLDEMQMIPVFNEDNNLQDFLSTILNNRLSIFSLNRIRLGDKVTKTIAGFLMQQIFLLAQTGFINEPLIVVIDEVSILENPILTRFLSELRKFNVSVILAGQYFNQISKDLQEAILANTSNYYLFRVSKNDANLLEKNLPFKLENDDSSDESERTKFLMNLKNRECVIKVSKNGVNYPMIKGITTDFEVPFPPKKVVVKEKDKKMQEKFDFVFTIDDVSPKEIMKKNSSSRKKVL